MTPAQPSIFEMVLPFVFMFAVFYFLMIRPQSKKAKEHDQFLRELKRGDSVITASGILGTIEDLTEQFVTLEVDEGVKMKILRKQVASSQAAYLQKIRSEKTPAVAAAGGNSKK